MHKAQFSMKERSPGKEHSPHAPASFLGNAPIWYSECSDYIVNMILLHAVDGVLRPALRLLWQLEDRPVLVEQVG